MNDETALNQINAPFGRRHILTLSDGTIEQLNSGSKLIYPPAFSGKTREVDLSGEGYFDVTRNTGRPFIVNTNYINIKVTGTRFNFSAFLINRSFQLSLLKEVLKFQKKTKSSVYNITASILGMHVSILHPPP